MPIIYLSLGSNTGNRRKNIQKALSSLENINIKKIKISSLYETSPVGPKQRNFYNISGKFKTDMNPPELLKALKNIEKKAGRKKSFRWGPRIIDIDILFYGSEKINLKNLTVPHKEIKNRLFVLAPMKEISSNFVHPVYRKTVKTLYKNLLSQIKENKLPQYIEKTQTF